MPDPHPNAGSAVLVIEPVADIRRMLAAAFRRWGVAGHFAETGPAAIELFRRHAADIPLALVEVALPHMDGPTTLDGLRAVRPDVKCWFVGGIGGGYTQAELLDRGAEGLLPKPFDLRNLRELLGPFARPAPRPMPGAERRTAPKPGRLVTSSGPG